MLVPWTPLSPSRRERTVRRGARLLGAAAAGTLILAALRAQPADPWLAFAALLAATGAIGPLRSRLSAGIEVGIDSRGSPWLRGAPPGQGLPEQRLQCVFAAPWLITLRGGAIWVPIWPDSLPGNTFRRLWVHIRWSSGRLPVDPPAGISSRQPK